MQILIRIILIALTIIGIKYLIERKEKYKLLTDNVFWICISWMACLILYYFSGIKYKVELDFVALLYIFVFWGLFFLGQYLMQKYQNKKEGQKQESNKKAKTEKKETEKEVDLSKKINLFPLFIASLVSIIIYTIYIIVINEIHLGETRNIKTDGFATLLQIISNSSLIIWLYELAYSILNDKKITIWGVASALIFNIPGFIISGRDALMIFVISTFIVFLYCGIYAQKVLKKECKVFKLAIKVFAVAFALILIYLIFLTKNRYGQAEDSALNMFKWSAGAQFPAYLEWIYKYLGGLGKVIINVVFYYSSQLSKFALVFNNYDGPYLFGMYQLHYVSRLLPESWNLNHMLVSQSLKELTTAQNVPGIKVFWETAIGYSIYDFGRIGTLIVAFVSGIIIEKINNWCKNNVSILKFLMQVFVCLAMFLTIEVSPLFDYYYIFPLFWLIVIIIVSIKKGEKTIDK